MKSVHFWTGRLPALAIAALLSAVPAVAQDLGKVKVEWTGKGDIARIMSGDHAVRRIGMLNFSGSVRLVERLETSEGAVYPAGPDMTLKVTTTTVSTISLSPEGLQGFADAWYDRWLEAFAATGEFEVVPIEEVQKSPTYPRKGKELPTPHFQKGFMNLDRWDITAHGSRHFGSTFNAISLASDDSYMSAVAREAGCDAMLSIRPVLILNRKGGGPIDGVKGQWVEVDPMLEVLMFIPHEGYAAASKAVGSKIPPFMKMNPQITLSTQVKPFKIFFPFGMDDQKKVTEQQVRKVLNEHFVIPMADMQGIWPTTVAQALAAKLR